MRTLHHNLMPKRICDKHCIYDVLPCPWPECSCGIPESEFVLSSALGTENQDVYYRHEWQHINQEKYYTWQLRNLSNWFSCKKTLWSEARRLNLTTARQTTTIYHYTTIDGFMGILDSRSTWLTDYSYLNDNREILHGIDIIRDCVKEIQTKKNYKDTAPFLEYWLNNLNGIGDRVCIASFSSEGDSLSQWRAYGGISIGFTINNISLHTMQLTINPVEYNKRSQYEFAKLYINHLCQAYFDDVSNNLIEKIPDVYNNTNQLIELASLFKDSSFQDEHEYRAVFMENKTLYNKLGLSVPKRHFRHSNGHIIPYVVSSETSLQPELYPLKFNEIVLGPNSDEMLERGVRELLTERGLGNVSIRRSNIPYRT